MIVQAEGCPTFRMEVQRDAGYSDRWELYATVLDSGVRFSLLSAPYETKEAFLGWAVPYVTEDIKRRG